jgi:hypothetical protein
MITSNMPDPALRARGLEHVARVFDLSPQAVA